MLGVILEEKLTDLKLTTKIIESYISIMGEMKEKNDSITVKINENFDI